MLGSTNLRFLFTPLVSNAVGIALAACAWCDDLRPQGWPSLAADHLIFKETTPHAKPAVFQSSVEMSLLFLEDLGACSV